MVVQVDPLDHFLAAFDELDPARLHGGVHATARTIDRRRPQDEPGPGSSCDGLLGFNSQPLPIGARSDRSGFVYITPGTVDAGGGQIADPGKPRRSLLHE